MIMDTVDLSFPLARKPVAVSELNVIMILPAEPGQQMEPIFCLYEQNNERLHIVRLQQFKSNPNVRTK